MQPQVFLWRHWLEQGLSEDLRNGDLTSELIFDPKHISQAHLVSRQGAILAGTPAIEPLFELLSTKVDIKLHTQDGSHLQPGEIIATLTGPTTSLLAAERTLLNVLQHLSGIATQTQAMVEQLRGLSAKLVDTRKTIPGLRVFQKYAVRVGGGYNHRFALDDGVLIKDNHIAAVGSITEAVKLVKAKVGHMVMIEVEIDHLDQLSEALSLPIQAVLLDNFPLKDLKEAVTLVQGRVLTEASGNVRPDTVATIARTGVDLISAGYLTHSVQAVDIALDMNQAHV